MGIHLKRAYDPPWPEFEERYRAELAGHPALGDLRRRARQGPITLVYAARDQAHNQAVVLKRLLESGPGRRPETPPRERPPMRPAGRARPGR